MTGTLVVIILSGLFLSFSNGGNDNFKGVATLLGSKTTSYKFALTWATITTFAGSITAFFLAQKLMVNFSGKGIVPDAVVQMSAFSVSVALAAAATVMIATRFGFPISTTHAITGALVGAGILASAEGVNSAKLFSNFFLPLLVSPVIAILSACLFYPLFRMARIKLNINRKSCLCIGKEVVATTPQALANHFASGGATAAVLNLESFPSISVGTTISCEERYVGHVWGINAKTFLDTMHFLSSGMVSFARGLNDTPKIAALLLIGNTVIPMHAIALTGIAIALGGVLMAKRIAETMSYQITKMNDGQGVTANLITSVVVIGASQLGLPVSTTHVSCGALFGIGAITRQAQWSGILKIVSSWVITLPVACTLGYLSFLLFKGVL